MTTSYEKTHPLYDRSAPIYRRNANLYDGGESMDGPDAARRYLTRHPFEKDKQYAIRLERAAYRNFAAPTVDLFASSVTNGVERSGIAELPCLESLLRDCDRAGASPDVFFKRVATRAAAVGAEFVLVDLPFAAGPVATRAEAEALGLRPYFVPVPALDVISWDYDDSGGLDWAVTRAVRQESDGPFSDYTHTVSVTLWTKTEWRRFTARGLTRTDRLSGGLPGSLTDGPSRGLSGGLSGLSGVSPSESAFAPDGQGALPLGMVPLVPFLYEPESPMTGRSVIDDVARLVIRVFNQDSELDKMLFDAALPLLAVFGVGEEEEEALVKATSALWRFADKEASLRYVEPSGAAFAAKRQQIQDDIDSIREISLRQTRPRGAGVESAEARRLDSLQIASQLADFARSCADAERRCWEIAGRLAGVDCERLDSITVRYNESFDPEALRERLTGAYLELRQGGDLSRETLWRRLGMDDAAVALERERMAAEMG